MSKQVVRTEAAPGAVSGGALLRRRSSPNGFVFVAGQLGLEPGAKRRSSRAGSARRPSRPSPTCAAILEAAGSSLDGGREDDRLPPATSTTSPA